MNANATTIETCPKCGLSYYTSLIPHECAEWTKGRTTQPPAAQTEDATICVSPHPWNDCAKCGVGICGDHMVEWLNHKPHVTQPDTVTAFEKHAGYCERCADTVKKFPDLTLFNDQLCAVGQRLFRMQPAPDAGEWSQFRFYPKRILDSADGISGVVVAEAQTEEQAAQIVSDHHAIKVLREALERTRSKLYEFRVWKQPNPSVYILKMINELDAVLAATTTQPDAGEERQ